MDHFSVSDHDLHALVDGQLAPPRRCEIEVHLATHPDAAARARGLRDQRELLAALGEALADPGPAPALASAAEDLARAVGWQRHLRRAVLAGAVGLVVAVTTFGLPVHHAVAVAR